MKKYIQRIILVFAMVLPVFLVNGQDTFNEGKIIFEISYPDMEMDNQMAAMMPTESVMYVKDNMSRTETSMGMGMSSATIMNSKTNEVTALMDMMGTKTATIMKDDGSEKGKAKAAADLKFELKEDTKVIAGITCKKAIMKNSDGSEFEMFYTETINSKSQFSKQWKNFKGFPMEYTISSSGFNMKMTAKSISKEKVSDDLFKIPADYKVMTQEEFTKMMGGK